MIKKTLFAALLATVGTGMLNAQIPVNFDQPKMDTEVENFVFNKQKTVRSGKAFKTATVKEVTSADETMSLTINCTNASKLARELRKKGFTATVITDNVIVADLTAEAIRTLNDDERVYTLNAPRQFYPKMKNSREASGADKVQLGTNLETPFDGTGVIIGVIDQGFQFKHAAFMDNNKKTRIVQYLNHSSNTSWSSKTPTTTIPSTDDGLGNHATHVTGIAAGSRTSGNDFWGIAPNAELYIVPSNFTDPAIEKAVRYISDYASDQGKRAVVNMSFGATVGPHDGTTLYDQTINNIIEEGDIFVAAAMGNEGQDRIHASYTFTSDDETKIIKLKSTDSDNYIGEIWCTSRTDGTRPFTVEPVYFNSNTLKEFAEDKVATISAYINNQIDAYNNKQCISFNVPYSKLVEAATSSSNLYLGLRIKGKAGETFHAWVSEQYGTIEQPSGTSYVKGDSKYLVGEGAATIPKAIAVAAYIVTPNFTNLQGNTYTYQVGNANQIANFSSPGPWFGTTPKPMVAAPGTAIVSAANRYDDEFDSTATTICGKTGSGSSTDYYHTMNGTSMATPMVTGAMALWLQANPDLTYDDLETIFKETSTRDSYTGDASATKNNVSFGFGKLNIYEGIKKAIAIRAANNGATSYNGTSPVTLFTSPQAMRVLFNDGESYANIRVYALSGQTVLHKALTAPQAGNEEVIGFNSLTPGVYMVNIETTRANITRKILVQ